MHDLSLTGKLYGDVDYVEERHRHRFEVRNLYFKEKKKKKK